MTWKEQFKKFTHNNTWAIHDGGNAIQPKEVIAFIQQVENDTIERCEKLAEAEKCNHNSKLGRTWDDACDEIMVEIRNLKS